MPGLPTKPQSPPLPPRECASPAEQRLSAIRFVCIDEAVPAELHSLIHSFAAQNKLTSGQQLCGYSLLVVSHNSTEEQLLALHGRVASLVAVTLLPSSLFLSSPTQPTSSPASSPPTRAALLSFLSLFSSWRVTCSGLTAEQKALVAHLTTSLSGQYSRDFQGQSHLVTNSSRSDKYAAFHNIADSCVAVHPSHLLRCYLTATAHTPTQAELQRLLSGLKVCVTGIAAEERNHMMRLIQAEGGEYSANLIKACTHLIAQKPEGEKYRAAITWGLQVVGKGWLATSVRQGRVADEKAWPVGTLMPHETEAEQEERKEAAPMETEANGGEQEQREATNGGGMNGHAAASDERDEERANVQSGSRQQQQKRQEEEKRNDEEEQNEDGRTVVQTTVIPNGETNGWKKKPRKDKREQKAEEDDSLKTVPLPERSQSPRPASPAAFAASAPNGAASTSSPIASAHAPPVAADADDSYLDTVQVLLCLPSSSALFLRCVAIIRAGGGTRLSSYRPAVTHLVTVDGAHVQSVLRADRFSLFPPNALTSSTHRDFLSALACPVVSPDWLEACHKAKRLVPSSPFAVKANEEAAAPPPALSRPSSVARQKVVSEFAAFNDGIAREKRDGASAASIPQKRRRRTRTSAKGVFAGKLFAFESVDQRQKEELLLSIRSEGGDVLAEDETEEDAHYVVANFWTDDLPVRYEHATFVKPDYISDCITHHTLQPPNVALDYVPLPKDWPPLPSFASHTFALTGFNRLEQEQLKRLIYTLGAKPGSVTDGMSPRNTHLVCKEGCAAGAKWELAWSDKWTGKVVRLQWLVECVRQGVEVPLISALAWRQEDGKQERQDEWKKAAQSDMEVDGGGERAENGGGKRAVVDDNPAPAGAETPSRYGPIIGHDADMLQRAAARKAAVDEADEEEDVDKTEQDSTAEHMDVDAQNHNHDINSSSAAHKAQPAATHDTAEEQTDILGPLLPPSPDSTSSSPFPSRYGRQNGQRTNRIYTPPKTPNSASAPAADEKSSGDKRTRRRRLAVEDKAAAVEPAAAEDDPFGFEGSGAKGKRGGKEEETETATTAASRESGQTKVLRASEEAKSAQKDKRQVKNGQRTEAGDVAMADSQATEMDERAAVNRKRAARTHKQVEEELARLTPTGGKQQEEKEGAGGEEASAPRSRMPGRKRLGTVQRAAEEEEEEAEYVPPASGGTAEEVKEETSRKRGVKDEVKEPAVVEEVVEERKQEPTSSRKGRAKRKPSPASSPESKEEAKDGEGKEAERSFTSTTDSSPSSSSGRKSARAQRKEQLKAQDAASPAKPRSTRHAAAQPIGTAAAPHSEAQPVRASRKRGAAAPDGSTSSDSASSSVKRVKAKASRATVSGEDDTFKYRFAIARASTKSSSADSLRDMIERLGAECIDEAEDYSLCSAVVVKDHTALKRTEKVLAAIVAGLPILPRSYIEDSSARGQFLSLSGYRLKLKDAVDDVGKLLMRAAERWQRKKRPFNDWCCWIADSRQEKMLTNVLTMGGGLTEREDVSECTDCLVDVEQEGVEAVLKRMWNAGVAVYRSALVVEYICRSDERDWDIDEFRVTKDNWRAPWSNPWKIDKPEAAGAGSQSTHGTEGAETEGRRKRR